MSKLSIDSAETIKPRDAIVVIGEARNRGVYRGEVPADDKRKSKVARDLVEISLGEWYSRDADTWLDSDPGTEERRIAEDVLAILAGAGVVCDEKGELSLGEPTGEVTSSPREEEPEERPADPAPDADASDDEPTFDVEIDLGRDGKARQEWTWDQIHEHVVKNGNRNLTVLDESMARRLEGVIGTEGEADKDESRARQDQQDPENDMEEPWEGYDKSSARDIIAKLREYESSGDLDDDARDYVRRYEHDRKARSTVLAFFDIKEARDERHDELDKQADDAVARDDERDAGREEDPPAEPAPESEPAVADGDDGSDQQGGQDGRHLAGVREAGHEARERALARADKEHLPVPSEPRFESDPELPRDLSSLGHDAVNQLALDFTACLSRATWLHALARIDHRTARRLLEHAERDALARAAVSKGEDGKSLSEWKARAVADADERVEELREQVDQARDEMEQWDALITHYKASYDALSRVEGFRHDEADRAR